ncbi:APC family permease, partial [Francisella tularensis subsp. holarctica]|nr:APC family permease [Francisella tularensis subsp. holarctica]
FANWFGSGEVISSEALATTQFLSGVKSMQWLLSDGVLTTAGTAFALLVLFVYLVINFYGVKVFAKVNNGITVFKMSLPFIIVIIFITYAFMH